jgi:hypothetical protein
MKEERYVSKITVILIKTRLQNIVGKKDQKVQNSAKLHERKANFNLFKITSENGSTTIAILIN